MIPVRAARPADHPALVSLFTEMQAHYRVPCPAPEAILAGIAARPAGTEILVAEVAGNIAGFATFSPLYPGPGLQPGLFLKELYVAAAHRGGGAGRCLLAALAGVARERGLGRVDWTADAGNARLLAFYDALGAARKTDKLFYRLDGAALAALAGGD